MEPATGITINELDSNGVKLSDADNVIHSKSSSSSDELNIYCIYSAYPTDLLANSTRWFKDGQQLVDVDRRDKSGRFQESITPTGYPVLTIRQVNRMDAGSYDCQLSNAVGSSERVPFAEAAKVEVNFRPSVRARMLRATSQLARSGEYAPNELVNFDTSQELILPGSSFVLSCDVVEAKPSKIDKFVWYRRDLLNNNNNNSRRRSTGSKSTPKAVPVKVAADEPSVIHISESGQFVLNSMTANFTPSSFTCSAFNSLGSSAQSNQIDIQLSYTPGKFNLCECSQLSCLFSCNLFCFPPFCCALFCCCWTTNVT